MRLKFLPWQLPLFFFPFAPLVSSWVEEPSIGRASTQDVPHHCLFITGPTASAPASEFFGPAAHVSWSLSLTPPPRCLHPVPPNPPVLRCMIFLVSIIDSPSPPSFRFYDPSLFSRWLSFRPHFENSQVSLLGRSLLSSPGCCLFPLRTQEGVHAVTDVWSTVPWAALLLLLLLCLGCMAFWECCQKSGVSRHTLDSWLRVCIRIPRLRKGRSLAPVP